MFFRFTAVRDSVLCSWVCPTTAQRPLVRRPSLHLYYPHIFSYSGVRFCLWPKGGSSSKCVMRGCLLFLFLTDLSSLHHCSLGCSGNCRDSDATTSYDCNSPSEWSFLSPWLHHVPPSTNTHCNHPALNLFTTTRSGPASSPASVTPCLCFLESIFSYSTSYFIPDRHLCWPTNTNLHSPQSAIPLSRSRQHRRPRPSPGQLHPEIQALDLWPCFCQRRITGPSSSSASRRPRSTVLDRLTLEPGCLDQHDIMLAENQHRVHGRS